MNLFVKNSLFNLRKVSRRSKNFSTAMVPAAAPSSMHFPDYLLSCPETKLTTLSNGLRVATEKWHGDTACVGVFIDAGSRYETIANNGAAHFLEHMAFKGTHRRGQMEIEISVENMGAHLNAYTSREQTVYYAKVFKSNVADAIDLLSDMLLHSKLDEHAVNKERDVIMREMKEVNKQKEELVLDNLHEVAFQGTGLGWTILGPPKNVMSLKSTDLRNYITTHYTAPRMVVVGAGNINHNHLVDLAEKYFGHLPTHPPFGSIVDADPAIFTGSHKRVLTAQDETVQLALAFQSEGWTSEFSFCLMLIQTMIGRWDRNSGKAVASAVGRELAENELCNSFSMFNTFYKDTGLIGLYFVAYPDKVNDAIKVAIKHTMKLCNDVCEDELARAKIQLKANMLMQLDSFSHICEDIGRQMLVYGRRLTPAELFMRIDSITSNDIKLCANRFFNDEDYALSAVGPVNNLMSYEDIRKLCIAE